MVAGRWCRIRCMALARWCHAGQASSPALPHRGHGQVPHALTRWNAPASLVSPPFLTLTRALCRHRSAQGCGQRRIGPGQWAARSWHNRAFTVSHHPVRPCWWLTARCRMCWPVVHFRSSLGLVRLGRDVVAVRRYCTHPVWLGRGGAIHRWGLAGAGWIAQIFFGQGGDLAVPRAYTYQTPHSCVGHNR